MKSSRLYPKTLSGFKTVSLAALLTATALMSGQRGLAQSITELPARYETVVENWSSELDWSAEQTKEVVGVIQEIDGLNQPGSEWQVARALYEGLDESTREELVTTYNYPMALMRGLSNRPANAGPANRAAMQRGSSQRPGMQLFMQADLTPAQRQQLRNIQMEFKAKQAELMQSEDLSFEQFRGKMISLSEEKANKFKEVLDAELYKEWNQMRTQRMAAQNSSRVARKKALSLSDEEENQLFQIHMDMRSRMRGGNAQWGMAQGGPKGGGAVNRSQRFQEMQQQRSKLAGILSDKQQDIAIIKFALDGASNSPMMRRPGPGMRQGGSPGMMQGARGMKGSRGMRGSGMRGPGNCMYYNSNR